ncbi:hypothetical protein N9H70_11005 [Pseudomonadales bacterium]|nr:hypothetical protein [Pseudomonadales bacterium]
MTITAEETIHGGAILRLLEDLQNVTPAVHVHLAHNPAERSVYSLTLLDEDLKKIKIGLYVKSSRKRLSPWRYTLTREHQNEIKKLRSASDALFIVLINGTDGYLTLNYKSLKKILDEDFAESEWISVKRKLKEHYRVAGTDGELDHPVARNSYPSQVVEYVTAWETPKLEADGVWETLKKFWS